MIVQNSSELALDTLSFQTTDSLEPRPTHNLSLMLLTLARVPFCIFVLTTSLYCLLAYLPFTYHWIIKGELLAWLPLFVKYHPCIYLATLGLVVPTVARDMQRVETRRLVLGFYVFHIAAGAWFILQPVLPTLENDSGSVKWALVFLTPFVWLAAIDYAGHFKLKCWVEAEQRQTNYLTIRSAALPALFLTVLYAAICYARFRTMLNFSRTEMFIIAFSTTISHLLIFVTVFIALNLVRILACRFRDLPKARFLLTSGLACVFGAVVVRYFVLSAISFDGNLANVYALFMSLTVVSVLSGISLRKKPSSRGKEDNVDELRRIRDKLTVDMESGTGAIRRTLRLRVARSASYRRLQESFTTKQLICLAALALLAYSIPARLARMDWDFMMQKLSVVLVWVLAFILWNSTANSNGATRKKPYSFLVIVLIAVIGCGGYKIMSASESRLPHLIRNEQLNVKATLEEYAAYDISFKVSHEVLSNIFDFSIINSLRRGINPAVSASSGTAGVTQPGEDNGFYGYLKKNTNLMASAKVEPVEVKLVESLKRTNGDKPNIFIFVVDSLRSDYLSPYNSKVPFTPNIESFARESVVMENAFTPYGGTVLAQPSIWTGTMQIHKQYVEPFYPMNALQKLIETEDYVPFITIDPILKIILKPSASIVELDQGITNWQGLDLANTLRELRTKMEQRQDKSRPVFAYTQAQNIHIHKLNRERREGPPAYEFAGFDSYYSSQIKHIDEGVGEFIKYLKESGQYDNSLIVLTSDHGDSIGEGGRWGHATWIFPEVLRIPIIIHLPVKFQKSLYWNPRSIAFSNDITPSIYYMLGHRPIVRNDVFGKPLFTLTEDEQSDYQQRSYMVASSYGPSYGILSDNGQKLFISDAINSKDYLFDLKSDPKGTRNLVTAEIRSENEKLIHRFVDAINRFYHFDPEQGGLEGK